MRSVRSVISKQRPASGELNAVEVTRHQRSSPDGDDQRTLLHRLDQDIIAARTSLGDDNPTVLSLTATYHNLLRMWAEA